MIYDVVEKFERDLIERTKLEKIDWKDLRALKENEFPDIPLYIKENLPQNEFTKVELGNSFYFKHKNGIIALLYIDNESGKDGSHSRNFILLVQIKEHSPVFSYDKFQENFESLYLAILNYFNRGLNLPSDFTNFLSWADDQQDIPKD